MTTPAGDANRTGRQPPQRRWGLALCVLVLLWPLAAWAAARALIVDTPPARAEAMVVLGGSAAFVERTLAASQLFREGYASQVLLTNDGQRGGWSSAQQRNPFFVERAAALLGRTGVPAGRIVILPQEVSGTIDEARLLRDYAAQTGLGSLLVVTSGYHSRRALWTFREAFAGSPTEVYIGAVSPGTQTPSPATWWLTPAGWGLVAGEYVKFLYYLLRFGG